MDYMFENEVRIMKKLRKHNAPGFPRIEAYGQVDDELGYIAMEILGANSLDLMRKVEQRLRKQKKVNGLPMPLVVSFAKKLIASLRSFHSLGYLHSDVKPNNVVLDLYSQVEDLVSIDKNGTIVTQQENARVFLVDFGLSEKYQNDDGAHCKPGKIDRQLGNKFFMSLSQLKKNVSSRKDDLEQLIYTLAFLAKGDLPWSLKRSYSSSEIVKAKSSPQILDIMFKELPEQFRTAFNYIRNLGFDEKPDYDWLNNLFSQIMESKNISKSYLQCKAPQIVTPEEITEITEQEKKLSFLYSNESQAFSYNTTKASVSLQLSQNTPLKNAKAHSEASRNNTETKNIYQSQELRNYINEVDEEEKKVDKMFNMDSATLRNEEDENDSDDSPETVRFCSMYKKTAKPMNLRTL